MLVWMLGLGRVEPFDFWLRCCRGWSFYSASRSHRSSGQRHMLHQSSGLCWRYVSYPCCWSHLNCFWVVGCWRGICLERGADLHMAQLMSLPLTVSCFSKIQIGFTFLVLAHLGSPGKGPFNGCVCVYVCVRACVHCASYCRKCDFATFDKCPQTVFNIGNSHLQSKLAGACSIFTWLAKLLPNGWCNVACKCTLWYQQQHYCIGRTA